MTQHQKPSATKVQSHSASHICDIYLLDPSSSSSSCIYTTKQKHTFLLLAVHVYTQQSRNTHFHTNGTSCLNFNKSNFQPVKVQLGKKVFTANYSNHIFFFTNHLTWPPKYKGKGTLAVHFLPGAYPVVHFRTWPDNLTSLRTVQLDVTVHHTEAQFRSTHNSSSLRSTIQSSHNSSSLRNTASLRTVLICGIRTEMHLHLHHSCCLNITTHSCTWRVRATCCLHLQGKISEPCREF
jgi:hypothetical protein